MMTSATPGPARPPALPPGAIPRTTRLPAPPLRRLDDLAGLTAAEAAAAYRAAEVPTLAEVSGDLIGRMLSPQGLGRGLVARTLRAFARWRWFPWRGKSFALVDADRGEGINRVWSDVRPCRWFRFETSLAPSRAGAFAALHLDYDNPGNPLFIRAIKDELRRVGPGLYLGQAYVVIGGRARLVLYFGLATAAVAAQ